MDPLLHSPLSPATGPTRLGSGQNHMAEMALPGSSSTASEEQRSDSGPGSTEQCEGSLNSTPPPTFLDIDRWQHHIDLQEFGQDLQAAAKAVFPNETKSRYIKVSVLMLCWEDEDPQLPVSLEIARLFEVFQYVYHFETEIWRIPDDNPHHKLNQKVLDFVEPTEESKEHLKIVYYAGHGKLSRERTLLWTSWRNSKSSKCPTVKWSGIQNVLEEAESDVLVLLDCCASGVSTTHSGNQANELIAACAFNSRANGVGPYSFTNALVIELRSLSTRPSFTIGELYSNIFSRTQSHMPEDGVERHPAPVHLVLTHERSLLRSIQLSVLKAPEQAWTDVQGHLDDPEYSMRKDVDGLYPERGAGQLDSDINLSSASSMDKFPRLAFAVRLKETVKVGDLSSDLFLDWLRCIPIAAEEVKIEAGFDSLSTLLIISLPMSLAAYLPSNPSIMCLGPVKSTNHLTQENQKEQVRTLEKYLFAEKQLTATLEESLTELERKSTISQNECESCKRDARSVETHQYEEFVARVREVGQSLLSLTDGKSEIESTSSIKYPIRQSQSPFWNINNNVLSNPFPPTPAMSIASRATSLDPPLSTLPVSVTSSYATSEINDAKRDSRERAIKWVGRRRRDNVVSPPRDKFDDKPLKGIQEKSPEDSAPVREGVAPLKDSKKDGVPPDARWTKISRKLVNPEALEAGKERYEARDNFVIVLRVLNKEEVQAYATATQQIRAAREEEEEREEREEARRKYQGNGRSDPSSSTSPTQP